jgi:phosphonopyruvate decarboxylase
MIEAGSFVVAAAERGFSVYSGVPCSYLTPFINYTIGSDRLRYVAAANEGDAVAIAAGAELGGLGGVAMFQNSGLGNAVNPLTSLTWTFRIPILLIVTWRGEPGGHADEPQHELMGQITPRMLELMDIPWTLFPASDAAIAPTLDVAVDRMQATQRPYALVMRKGSVADSELSGELRAPVPLKLATVPRRAAVAHRQAMLTAIRAADSGRDVLVATTGYMGRELYALGDRPNQLYMVGSMGCSVSLALGIALAQPRRRVIAIDGDGAALMRLGALTTVAYERPDNLVHIVIDNGRHESTGGQSTVSPHVDFCAIAAACGYPRVAMASEPAELEALLAAPLSGPLFIHVPVLPGVPANLPRPVITPAEVAARLRQHLKA